MIFNEMVIQLLHKLRRKNRERKKKGFLFSSESKENRT